MTQTSNETIFEAVGGHSTFTRLVDVFYEHVDRDEVLIAMYPEGHDLT
ncbi:MAG: globin, partial [Brevibacterium sp.]|nr:globin [Brevibacterium sp.]